MNLMENLGSDFDNTGSVMTPEELAAMRKKKGECVGCGRKCFKKKMFKMIPLTEPGLVDNGTCLRCNPKAGGGLTQGGPGGPVVRPASGGMMPPPGGGIARSVTAPKMPTPNMNRGVASSMPPLSAPNRINSLPPPNRGMASGGMTSGGSLRSVGSARSGGSGGGSSGGGAVLASVAIAPADEPVQMATAAATATSDSGGGYGGGGYSEIGGGYDGGAYDDYGAGYDDYGGSSGVAGYTGGDYDDGGYGDYGGSGPVDPVDFPPVPPLRCDPTVTVVECAYPNSRRSHSAGELEALKSKLSSNAEKGLEDIATFELSKDDMDTLAGMGAPRAVADAMGNDLGNITTQKWGCSAVWNMSCTSKAQRAFVSAGILDSILPVMEANINDAGFQEQAIGALGNLGAAKENLRTLVDREVPARIIDAMNQHGDNVGVQMKACDAFTNLAAFDPDLKKKVMDAGAGGAIVIGMVMNPNNQRFLEKAIRCMRNLAVGHDGIKFEIANSGGVDSVISAMQVYRDAAEIQQEACWALANLSTTQENTEVIGDCGGIDVIVRTLWVHAEHRGALEFALRALFNVSTDPHNAAIILDVGGISAIVSLMQGHPDSPNLQEMGLAVLYNLAAESEDSKLRVVDEEALDAIVLSMVLHTDDAMVQERACHLLQILCIPDNYKPMFAANIVELVSVAGDKFPGCRVPHDFIIAAMDVNEQW